MRDSLRIFLSFLVAVAFFLVLYNRIFPRDADKLYVNAVVYTLDTENTVAGSIAVRGDRIVGVGTREELEKKFNAKEVVDVGGRAIFPGFIDAHAHVTSLGIARLTVDLVGSSSEAEVAERVAARVRSAEKGIWIRGRGWDQNDWKSRQFPHHRILDRAAPNNPVVLTRVDGHAFWVNKTALDLAGITSETQDPEGGKIVRDAQGNPTGVLVDEAKSLVTAVLPPVSDGEVSEAIEIAIHECLSYGLTTVHDMGVDLQDIRVYRKLIDEGKFPFRIYAAIGGTEDETWKEFLKSGPLKEYGNHRLAVRSVKLYVDGALGSRGAALVEPYADDPTNRGLTVTTEADLQRSTEEALQNGFQVCTHAIGDRGNNIILNVYEKALKKYHGDDSRLRVEHAQVLLPSDIPRFAQLGVVPSMQQTHCTSDMYWAEARLGPDRVRGAYVWRSLLKTGVVIPGGSDFPVEHPNPLLGIYAGVTRQDPQGHPKDVMDVRQNFQLSKDGVADPAAFNGGWYVSETMTREEAIRSFTTWAAWAGFEEETKGSIAEGKFADFVVLSADIMKIPAPEILQTVVEMTVVGGKEVYKRQPVSM